MVHCCVPYCTADDSKKDVGVTFHKFPRDTELRDKWNIAISRPGTKPGTLWSAKESSKICSKHFKPCDFSISTTKKVLLPKTVPSIFPRCRRKLKSTSNRKKPAPRSDSLPPKRRRLVQKRSDDKLFDNAQPTSSIANTRQLKISKEIMEEPHFIKCEPEWSPETEEIFNSETEDYFPTNNLTRIKTETEPSCDPEFNAEEENRDSFIECETQIVKEEIIEEEEDISGRNYLDHDLDLPATSNDQTSSQDFTLNDDLKHPGELNYPCCHCEKVFKRAPHLKKHMYDTHDRKGSYECKECNRLFTWPQNLRDHAKIHRGKKAFQCTICEKSFLRAADLRRHMVVHTGERSFTCSICCKMFSYFSNLRSHMKVHSGIKPYSCNTCNKSFSSKGNLKKHVMIHTGVRPYSCSYCDKAFIESANLKQHLRVHSADTFPCSHCRKSFDTRKELEVHLLRYSVKKECSSLT